MLNVTKAFKVDYNRLYLRQFHIAAGIMNHPLGEVLSPYEKFSEVLKEKRIIP